MQQLFRSLVQKAMKPVIFVSIPLTMYKLHQYYEDEKTRAQEIYEEIQTQNYRFQNQDYKQSSIEKNLRMYLNRNIVETLKEKEVREGGVEYLNQIIRQKLVIDAILDVLLFCIKDDEFIDEAKNLGRIF
jgi:hypothetical protein